MSDRPLLNPILQALKYYGDGFLDNYLIFHVSSKVFKNHDDSIFFKIFLEFIEDLRKVERQNSS